MVEDVSYTKFHLCGVPAAHNLKRAKVELLIRVCVQARHYYPACRFVEQIDLRGPSLEKEFRAQLNEPRRIGVNDLAKCGAVDIAVDSLRAKELSVIEYVERFDTKLE